MRIALVSIDTLGGIQPYVALARGLAAAGHDVRMVAPEGFRARIESAGVAFRPLSGDVEAVVRGAANVTAGGSLASMRFAAAESKRHVLLWMREALAACEGVDLITGGVGGMVVGLSVAEKIRVPFIEAHLQPVSVPWRGSKGVLAPWIPDWLGAPGQWLGHALTNAALWLPFEPAMRAGRREVLGLTGRATAADRQPVLYGFSRHVVDVQQDDRRARYVTGYWFLPAAPDWRPAADLEAFLARGGPIVSIGFGSMANESAAQVTDLVVGALRDVGVRAVLLTGWGGLAPGAHDEVFCAEALPHDWLFPRVDAIVHHGGAGTTGASLRAGKPTLVVPFTMDQPFWASRVVALGAGPAPIPRKLLTRERLATALRETLGRSSIREHARGLGERIRGEDGVANAVARYDAIAAARAR